MTRLRKDQLEARDANYLRRFGYSFAEYKAIRAEHQRNGRGPYQYYKDQKDSVRIRGVAWQFTFASWWKVWTESGRWNQRGARVGQYVMARHGDQGPYNETNVRITTSTENNCERLGNCSERILAVGVLEARKKYGHFHIGNALKEANVSKKTWAGIVNGRTKTIDAGKAKILMDRFSNSEARS